MTERFPDSFENQNSGDRLKPFSDTVLEEASGVFERPSLVQGMDLPQEVRAMDDRILEKQQQAKTRFMDRLKESAKKNPLVSAFLVAGALHLPITPQGQAVGAHAGEFIDEVRHSFIIPQRVGDVADALKQMLNRRLHTKTAEVSSYKQAIAERLSQGEDVSLEEAHFKLAELQGVPKEKLDAGRKYIDDFIETYSAQMNGKIDRALLEQMVAKMYEKSTYKWGSADPSSLGSTGERNCNAVEKALEMVLEGMIKRLPADQQSSYEIGRNYESQHVRALITIKEDGEKTYVLDGHVEEWKQKQIDGTATVSLKEAKRAMVAEKPMQVTAGAGSSVESGPAILVMTDQPVEDNIVIQGKLKGSDYVLAEARKDGDVPMPKFIPIPPDQIIELTMEDEVKTPEDPSYVHTYKTMPDRFDAKEMSEFFKKHHGSEVRIGIDPNVGFPNDFLQALSSIPRDEFPTSVDVTGWTELMKRKTIPGLDSFVSLLRKEHVQKVNLSINLLSLSDLESFMSLHSNVTIGSFGELGGYSKENEILRHSYYDVIRRAQSTPTLNFQAFHELLSYNNVDGEEPRYVDFADKLLQIDSKDRGFIVEVPSVMFGHTDLRAEAMSALKFRSDRFDEFFDNAKAFSLRAKNNERRIQQEFLDPKTGNTAVGYYESSYRM